MLRLRTALLASSVALIACTGGQAASIILTANITTGQEVPPTTNNLTNSSTGQARPLPFGTATFVLDTTNPTAPFMTFTATIFNIDVTGSQTPNDSNDNLLNAHIHAGPLVAPGVNGPVAWGFFGSPFNDNNPNDSPNPGMVIPFTTGVGGTFSGKWDAPEGNGTTLIAQLANIQAGRAYINFHTTQNPGGEIRGFLIPPSVPEPSSILLLGIGAVAVIGASWRPRKRTR
jgi:hypothetical protein